MNYTATAVECFKFQKAATANEKFFGSFLLTRGYSCESPITMTSTVILYSRNDPVGVEVLDKSRSSCTKKKVCFGTVFEQCYFARKYCYEKCFTASHLSLV